MSENNNTSQWKTRQSLLGSLKDPSDQKAWKEFVEYYDGYIYNILRSFKIDASNIEDLKQNIILSLWKHFPEFKQQKDKFRYWLSTVIKNEARYYLRNKIRRSELLNKNKEYISDQLKDIYNSSDIEQTIEEEWNLHVSNMAWDTVKLHFKQQAQDIFLMSLEGVGTKDIAEKFKMKENTVLVYKNRIKNALIDEIRELNLRIR